MGAAAADPARAARKAAALRARLAGATDPLTRLRLAERLAKYERQVCVCV